VVDTIVTATTKMTGCMEQQREQCQRRRRQAINMVFRWIVRLLSRAPGDRSEKWRLLFRSYPRAQIIQCNKFLTNDDVVANQKTTSFHASCGSPSGRRTRPWGQ